ncbi:MAG: SAF domain-containing protein, partial [Nocardioidaceae bacterium]|nr:SAF domain-containing protein [Nocardioidaceae bacterium]
LETRGGSQTVLVAAESIQAGKTVTTGQLATTEISGGANTSTIPSIHRDDIAGQLASSNIPAGTVLNPEQFAIKVEPDEGMSIVAVPVKSSQLPAIGLRPGDMVTVVVTASGKGAAGSGDGVEAGTTWQATVAAVGGLGDDGVRTIDVTLDTGAAEEVASAGGTGRLAIILNPSAR